MELVFMLEVVDLRLSLIWQSFEICGCVRFSQEDSMQKMFSPESNHFTASIRTTQ